MTDFGLTPQGYVPMRQSDWLDFLNSQWTSRFGKNINLDPRTNNGQLIGILSERFAYLDELVEAIYQASYPAGAEGVAVDNILALSGLQRLAATPPKTQPTPLVQSNGLTLYGLVLFGTPGTTIPAGSLLADTATPAHVFSLDNAVTIQPAANSVQALVLSNTPTSGGYQLTLTSPSGTSLTTPSISWQALAQQTQLIWSTAPTTGTWTLTLGAATTSALPYNASAAAVASAINSALGINTVTASGSVSSGITITWPSGPIYFASASTDASAPSVINPVQASISSLYDAAAGTYPFADVAVTGAGTVLTISFGAMTLPAGSTSSAALAIPAITLASSSLQSGTTATNVTVTQVQQGAPAQGLGTATGVMPGVATIKAGTLTVIQTPVTGWSGVTNQLDCIAGTDAESDSDALVRRKTRLENQAQGPLASVLARVQAVPGVTQALAFSNTTNAAQQIVTFLSSASTGTFQLSTGTSVTSALPYNLTAAQMQTALQQAPGYAQTTVTGNATYGFVVDFGGALGGQSVPLLTVVNNTTGVTIRTSFGRYPKSIEMVVAGGSNVDVANAIYQACPTGIATYGSPVLLTTISATSGSTSISTASTAGLSLGLSVNALGITPGTYITGLSGNNVTLSAPAVGTYSNVSASFGNATAIADSNGYPCLIGFSRPQAVPVYISVQITTDQYLTPGVPSSGQNLNARWSPAMVPQIQAALLRIGNAIPIGGTITGLGSNGLVGAFNDVPGVYSYALSFGLTPNPTSNQNVSLLPQQLAYFTQANVVVSYT